MDADKVNEAAELHSNAVFNKYPEDVTDNTLEFECNKAFRRGAKWLMTQPLSDRLTDEEKEKIRAEYRQGFYPQRNLLIALFGYDLFNDK